MEKNNGSFRFIRLLLRFWKNIRDSFAKKLNISEERKSEIYIDLAKSASLKDLVYWLQIFFSAGIATLGLILNSPAVIIGAMLISPLMGPILSAGLAFATGDLILAVRAFVSLFISTLGAILFAVLLVAFLPFKEATSEILARTEPNTLDLGIAFFSGAIGSIAICKEIKGVVTSIPGVAIAVALMPPLCVVGYGIGVALSFNSAEGLSAASGGGLLYLTNLVAITFTAMVVFMLLRIDTAKVREKVSEWRNTDSESIFWQNVIAKIPTLEHAREIRSLSLRLLMILIPLALIFIPLSQSYSRVKMQIQQKQAENEIQKVAKNIWDNGFSKQPNGQNRTLDEIRVNTKNDKTEVYLRVIDSQPYSQEERNGFLNQLAKQLNRRADSLSLQIVEIAAAANAVSRPKTVKNPIPPTISELESRYIQEIKNSLTGLTLPPPAKIVDFRTYNSGENNSKFEIFYLSEREIDGDARNLLAEEIKNRLNLPDSEVSFRRIPGEALNFTFSNKSSEISTDSIINFDNVGKFLQNHPKLRLEISLLTDENKDLISQKQQNIKNYLKQNWFVNEERINFIEAVKNAGTNTFRIFRVEQDK